MKFSTAGFLWCWLNDPCFNWSWMKSSHRWEPPFRLSHLTKLFSLRRLPASFVGRCVWLIFQGRLFTVLIMRCKIEIRLNIHLYLLNMWRHAYLMPIRYKRSDNGLKLPFLHSYSGQAVELERGVAIQVQVPPLVRCNCTWIFPANVTRFFVLAKLNETSTLKSRIDGRFV